MVQHVVERGIIGSAIRADEVNDLVMVRESFVGCGELIDLVVDEGVQRDNVVAEILEVEAIEFFLEVERRLFRFNIDESEDGFHE